MESSDSSSQKDTGRNSSGAPIVVEVDRHISYCVTHQGEIDGLLDTCKKRRPRIFQEYEPFTNMRLAALLSLTLASATEAFAPIAASRVSYRADATRF